MVQRTTQNKTSDVEQWIPNCGAPLDPGKVKAGLTWDSASKQWMRHEDLGATVTKAPHGWWKLFETPQDVGA